MSKHASRGVPVRLGVIGLYVSMHAAKVDTMGSFRITKSQESSSKNSISNIGLNFTNHAEFLADIPNDGVDIEIGPFANPLLHGPNVKYLDVLPTEQLITRARELDIEHQPDLIKHLNQVEAILEIQSANGPYIDAHAWQLVPKSFALLVKQIFGLRIRGLKLKSIFSTAPNTQEFFSVLSREP